MLLRKKKIRNLSVGSWARGGGSALAYKNPASLASKVYEPTKLNKKEYVRLANDDTSTGSKTIIY